MTQTATILDLAELLREPLVGTALAAALLLAARSLGLQALRGAQPGPRAPPPALSPAHSRRPASALSQSP